MCGNRVRLGQSGWRRTFRTPHATTARGAGSIYEIVRCVVPAPERLGIVAPSFANQRFCDPRVRRVANCPSEPVAVNYAHDAKPIVAEVDTVDSWGFGHTFSFWPRPHPRSAGVKVEIDSALRDPGKPKQFYLYTEHRRIHWGHKERG